MRILRFDSVGGASGDMILGALVGLGVDPKLLEIEIQKLIPEHFHLRVGEKTSFGASGVYLTVDIHEHGHRHAHAHSHDGSQRHSHAHWHDHDAEFDCSEEVCHCHSGEHDHAHGHCHDHDEHDGALENCHCHEGDHDRKYGHCHDLSDDSNHESYGHVGHSHVHGRTYADIRNLLENSDLREDAKNDALAAFKALAAAEAEAHQTLIEDVHFHEVGATDSIIDTVGCALALRMLNVDGISLSPLPVGEGTFRCAHGVYPLPAPAVAILLRDYGLPVSYDVEKCEMLTPTATSLFAVWNRVAIPNGARITASVNSFGTREMATRPNLLRATLYETDTQTNGDSCPYVAETLYELETNIDDATGERLATAAAALFRIGALDVWFEPIQMKKGRPASRFCALVSESERQEALDAFFRHSGTFGVRETPKRRYSLFRRWQDVQTEWGSIRVKVGETRHGAILTVAPEFDDVVAVAEANNLTFEHVYRETLLAYNSLK